MVKKILPEKMYNHKSAEEGDSQYLEAVSYIREFPPKSEVRAGLKSLVDRGLFFNIIFTKGENSYSYPQQYRDSFSDIDFGHNLDLHHFNTAAHIMTHPSHQVLVVKTITQWLVDVINKIEKNNKQENE